MNQPYVLLVTPDEHAQITKLIEMGLTGETLSLAMGEIVQIPGSELALPIYYKVDPRAPELRFDYHRPPPPTDPPAASPQPSANMGPTPTLPQPARIHISLDFDDLAPEEATALIGCYAR